MGAQEQVENYRSYSVLMSVYSKESPAALKQSMKSIANQTIKSDDFILVCDGPLNDELDAVIKEMQGVLKDSLKVVRLPKNVGLGRALNEGMKYSRHNIIARMDSDDISRPDRCEKQLKVLCDGNFDVVSGTVEEFSSNLRKVEARRVLPERNEEIIKFAKWRNPFNHPCVMYRKDAVEAAGGYQDFYLLEDYYLWLRMLMKGSRGYNIQEPLLWMRAGKSMYKRRSGREYARSQRKLFRYMHENGFISSGEYIISCFLRTVSAHIPNWLRQGLFNVLVRKQERWGLK